VIHPMKFCLCQFQTPLEPFAVMLEKAAEGRRSPKRWRATWWLS